jgi:hypothetical protein
MRSRTAFVVRRSAWVLGAACLIPWACGTAQESRETRATDGKSKAPAEAGRRIVGLRFLDDTIIRRKEFTGDNWHTTWAADGNQYVLQCDGRGYNTRLWKLIGAPPDFRFEPVASHPGPRETRENGPKGTQPRYYGFGIVAVGDRIYHCFSTAEIWFKEPCKFIGAKLIVSPDGGDTWRNQDGSSPVTFEALGRRNRENMLFYNEPGEAFSLLTMLQMGKGYALNQDGFLYVYAPNGNTEGTMNQLVLCRVRKDKALQRDAYEFCASVSADGRATWSKAIEDRKPIHTFPEGWVNKFSHPYAWHPSVVYVEGLGVYLMANWGMGTNETGKWFVKPSYLGFWIADRPWGPWRQIHEDKAWFPPGGDPRGQCYQPQIMPGWIAPDGKSFWIAWTQFPRGYYFQCQKVEVVTK